jgi:O-antigen/teichoic acid export membrane protein
MTISADRPSNGIKAKLNALHQRMGDFWWYSLMLFLACRFADALNAFVGLWLVPKYVPPSELGAVMPLMQFASFLAIPIAAFSNTFRNELTRLSVNKEFGKLKTLMRGVFISSAVFLFLAIIIARLIMPAFLERIRIVEGSLGLIIIATSFVSAVSPIYSNALQSLKKFKAQSIISILGAPIRLLAMLVTMPFRALSGYFIGQASIPVFSMAASVFALKKELSVKAEPYWEKDITRQFGKLFIIFLISGLIGGFNGITEATIIRQRLSDLDSAGYYMATRFSEIAGFLCCTLAFTIFPFTAEKAAKGESVRPLLLKAFAANATFCLLIATPFLFCGKWILSLLPNGELYSAYWWVIPWLIGLSLISSIIVLYTLSETSANRFNYLKWYLLLDFLYPVLLLVVTGHGYFSYIIPESWTKFLNTNNIYSLKTMLCWMTINNSIKSTCCIIAIWQNKKAQ